MDVFRFKMDEAMLNDMEYLLRYFIWVLFVSCPLLESCAIY